MISRATAGALAAAAGRRSARLADLRGWLAIPSISADPRRAGAVRAAGRWLGAWLSGAGARVEYLPTGGGPPVVVGRVPGRRPGPAVLVYGHYDVQPPGPGWTVAPFAPVVRDGLLLGRGTNDDKGQLFAHLAALDAWCRTGGPPVPVTVVAEGAEEVGSRGFAVAAEMLRRRIGDVGVIIVSDTERADLLRPAVTVSQRGALKLHVTVDAGGPAVHAGRYGGALVDPSLVLARALLQVESLARDWRAAAREPVARRCGPTAREPVARCGPAPRERPPVRVLRTPDAEIRRRVAGRATRPGDLHRRTTLAPAVTVTALRAGDGSTASPGRSSAYLDIRLPPGVPPAAVARAVRHRLRWSVPAAVRVHTEVIAAHHGDRFVPNAGLRRAVEFATTAGFGTPPAYVRSGGSIPAVGVLRRAFGIAPVLLGLGTPGGGAHGPDEHIDISGWFRSIDTGVALLGALGGLD